jgi:O-antigen/teichoic acid export membrane protein
MSTSQENNKRIAKNTFFLYFRMLLSMAVSLYTSRVILQTLGVSDYGIYGVVGGVVEMFTFINASMSGATSRFITYALGKKDKKLLDETFSMAFYEHLCIAGIILLIVESVGLWFLNYKMNIPADRMVAANWVLQFSCLSMVVGVTQVPYSASIIAHERMGIYAYVELANTFLRLLVVYLLVIGDFDKLILFGFLNLCVSILIAMTYRVYCKRNFAECTLRKVWRKDLFKQMISFSGWDLYGNMSVTARTQGVNMLLNLFFGPKMNAAASIAARVQGIIMGFANNVLTAVRPQIVKYYAQGEYHEMAHLMHNAIRVNFLILAFLSVPLIAEMHYVFHLWLGIVPAYTIIFCTFTLFFNFFANMSTVIVSGIHATGKIFRPSFINGSLYLLVVPVSYIGFKMGLDSWTSYAFNVGAVFIGMLSNAYTINMYVKEFKVKEFVFKDLIPCMFTLGVGFLSCLLTIKTMDESFIRLVLTCAVSIITLLIFGVILLVPKSLTKKIYFKVIRK